MNCSQANSISLIDLLDKLGHSPVSIKNMEAWYYSPFRKENTPSFRVNIEKNNWKDWGISEAGNTIDLCIKLFGTDVKESLKKLSELNLNEIPNSKSIQSFSKETKIKVGTEINLITSLEDTQLINYCNLRSIPNSIAINYLKEVHYTVRGNKYKSLAFKNDMGGFELRNNYSKTCISPKHYTSIIKTGSNQINVFEGFFDFLSALVYFKKETPDNNTLILNSLANYSISVNLLSQFKKIHLFLDNDNAGNTAVQEFKTMFSRAIDYSKKIYPNHKDFNNFLINNKLQ